MENQIPILHHAKSKKSAVISEMYLRTGAPSEDSDQLAHLPCLIKIFPGHILDSEGCNVSSGQ